MGEGKRNREKQKVLLTTEPRCIYCAAPPDTLEHMPPITLFRGRQRPKGMVYACCTACNNRTSAADLVASFMARMATDTELTDWQFMENMAQKFALNRKAPGFLEELFNHGRVRNVLLKQRGVLTRQMEIKASGQLTRSYLNVFSAKIGMALYREHVGEPLPLEGIVHTMWFTNAGLSADIAEGMLRMMPGVAQLTQGKFSSSGQFGYHFNTDQRTIVAALVGFQQGLHVFIIATGTPDKFPIPNGMVETQWAMKPGQLVSSMPGRNHQDRGQQHDL